MRTHLLVPVIAFAAALFVFTAPSLRAARSNAAGLPAGETAVASVLERSPRHGEFVDIPYEGHAPLRTWVVYPERKDKAGVVLVIHEIFGLSDWIRGVADQFAAEGFIAVAPDLVSGLAPGGGGTDSASTRDDVVKLVRQLTPEEAAARLAAVRAWAARIPAANGKLGTVGFCWGGGRSFACATTNPPPQACVVFYGAAPDSANLLNVRAPIQGHYGGDDARITATLDATRTTLASLQRKFEPYVYAGAGHGFLRQQDGRDGANLKATQAAWPSTIGFLRKHLR